MKYVPSLPPPITGGVDIYAARPLPGVRPVRSVQPRSLPPLVFQRPRRESRSDQEERRHDRHLHGERRIYCRRIEHRPALLELRSGIDRRRRAQRATDPAEHIDEKA